MPKTLSYDNDDDGIIDMVTFFTYYEDCFPKTVKTDAGNDGIIDEAGYYTYDHPRKIGRLDRDTNYDGTIDEYEIAYGRGEMGELFFRDHYSERGFDGILKVENYDGNGNLTSVTECTAFDVNGYCLKEETDDGPDGVVDEVSYHAFNEKKEIVKWEKDVDSDGFFDSITYFYYYENGIIKKEENYVYSDDDGDYENPSSVFVFNYDNKGNVVSSESTVETVLPPPLLTVFITKKECDWSNTYDGNGNLVETITDCQSTTIIGTETKSDQLPVTAMYLEWFRCDGNGTSDPGVPGDLNGNGDIDLADVVLIMKILTGDESVEIVNHFDISGDGTIGLEEALFLLREISKP